jgi:MFS family permease
VPRPIHLLYTLSGLLSLAYQVVWFRIYVDRFGSSTLTFALVLCNFIAGLGLGALFSKRLSDRVGRIFLTTDPSIRWVCANTSSRVVFNGLGEWKRHLPI